MRRRSLQRTVRAMALVTALLTACVRPGVSQSFSFPIRLGNVPDSAQLTTLEFGPDQRLYCTDLSGGIYVLTILRNDTTEIVRYDVVNTEYIASVRTIQNYNDDGTVHDSIRRQATGIHVRGTADHPIIYVTSSDYRINSFQNIDSDLNTNSGIVSRLTWTGTEWDKVDLVRGLPRSEENHATNGLWLDEASNTLYVAQGGNTNGGGPFFLFGYLTEYALSAAILAIDLDTLSTMPVLVDSISGEKYIYDIPTVDDPTRPNRNGIDDPMIPGYDGIDVRDPHGGNDGLNQARLIEGGPVQVYCGGFRNPYDVVMTQVGIMYTMDNAGNPNWGGRPTNAGFGTATNSFSFDFGDYMNNIDRLHRIDSSGYYGGHANPIRANPDSAYLFTDTDGIQVFRTQYDPGDSSVSLPFDWPPVDSALRAPEEGILFQAESPEDQSIYFHEESTNGLAEYTATNFDSAMTGDLLAAGYNSNVYHIRLDENGDVDSVSVIANIGLSLDVDCQGDDDAFPGTIWIAALQPGSQDPIRILEPTDLTDCVGGYFAAVDEDLDGYTNADEIDNGTNPCLGSDAPDDFDQTLINGFKVSDLNDPDDDDDGIPDSTDFFCLDAHNGLATTLPLELPLLNSDPGTGFYGLGLTGLMSNLSRDYLELWQTEDNSDVQIIAGGATGVLTLFGVDSSDARGTLNDQTNAFQVGFPVDSTTPPLFVRVDALGILFKDTIEDFQSVGCFIGTGDQDNYVKIAAIANNGDPAIEVLREVNGAVTAEVFADTGLNAALTFNMAFALNPANGYVFPHYSLDDGPWQPLGDAFYAEGPFLDAIKGQDAIAVGLIASGRGSQSLFDATWDRISVDFDPVQEGLEFPGEWIVQNDGFDCSPNGQPGSCCSPRHECAYVESGNKFYLLGGREEDSRVEIYDPISDIWTVGATPPIQPIHHFQAFDYHGLIIVAGGLIGDFPSEDPQDTILVYDPVVDEWYFGPAIPQDRLRGAAAASLVNDTMYLVGGNTEGHLNGAVNWTDRYDFASNTWDTLPDAPNRRDHFHTGVINGKIYAAAGRRSGDGPGPGATEPTVDVFDITSGTWDTLPGSIPTVRAGAASAVIGEELLVMGGEIAGAALSVTEALNVANSSWRSLPDMNYNRHGAQALVNNGAVHVAAGSLFAGGGAVIGYAETYYPYGLTSPILHPTIQSVLASPDTVTFETTIASDTSKSYVEISNTTGNQAILLTDIVAGNSGVFSIDTIIDLPRFIKPGTTIRIPVLFVPDGVGAISDSLIVTHTGANAPQSTVLLIGTGQLSWAGGPRIYVDSSNGGEQFGTSWDSALVSLSVALDAARNFPEIQEIWIASGSYFPEGGREASFAMKSNVALYGGFAGTESTVNERDPDLNPTVLSGDIGIAGDSTDNVYHVLDVPVGVEDWLLDGLIIERGNADGTDPGDQRGAGIRNAGSGSMSNCTIRLCSSVVDGSAIYSTGASAELVLWQISLLNNTDPYIVNRAGSHIRMTGQTFLH